MGRKPSSERPKTFPELLTFSSTSSVWFEVSQTIAVGQIPYGYVNSSQICLNMQQHVIGARLDETVWGEDVRED